MASKIIISTIVAKLRFLLFPTQTKMYEQTKFSFESTLKYSQAITKALIVLA